MGLKRAESVVFSYSMATLKSDQNGIETLLLLLSPCVSPPVKIRPKWDWNRSPLVLGCMRLQWLKSDQNGIETEITRPIYMKPHPLKSDQNGIETASQRDPSGLGRVKIRPKWDWNIIHVSRLDSLRSVKIRPKWDWNNEASAGDWTVPWVKIRPKWDWNPPGWWRGGAGGGVKIRPKWDWNVPIIRPSSMIISLKSDQNGIETKMEDHPIAPQMC